MPVTPPTCGQCYSVRRGPSPSARGGGRATAPGGMQRPNARLGLALLGAVTLLRRRAGCDKNPLAVRRGADPEPLGADSVTSPASPAMAPAACRSAADPLS